MVIVCALCQNDQNFKKLKPYKNINTTFKGINLYQCPRCHFVFAAPAPAPQDLDYYYKNVWLSDEKVTSSQKETHFVYRLHAQEKVVYLKKHLDFGTIKKIVDVGAGFGDLLMVLKQEYPHTIYYGTDPNTENIEGLKKNNILAFEDLAHIPEKEFDLMTLCQVLEHIPDPLEYLKKILMHLKSGGYLYLDVPNRDDQHKPHYEPHVNFFDVTSLTFLAKKLNLKIISVSSYGPSLKWLKLKNHLFFKIIDKLWRNFFELVMREDQKEKYYRLYEFDKENKNGWWLRILLQKN